MAKRFNDSQVMSREKILTPALALGLESDIYTPEGDENGLSALQWQAILLLAAGVRQVAVSAQLSIRQETISRWKNDVRFVAALNQAIREQCATIEGSVREAAVEAVAVLRETMKSDDPRLRLTAALSVLRLHGDYIADAQLPTTPADVARIELSTIRKNIFFG